MDILRNIQFLFYKDNPYMQLDKLREITNIQCQPGNYDQSNYMRGLANGLILAESIFTGEEPKYFEAQE